MRSVSGKVILVMFKDMGDAYLVTLEGSGTYLIKEELKYQGFRWNRALRRWEKIFDYRSDAEDMVKYLKRFIDMEISEVRLVVGSRG